MHIVSIVIQGLLGLMFVMTGVMKLSGAKMHVESFKSLGLPQWFRVVTGLVQLATAIMLIIGIWSESLAAIGGLLLAVTMIGAVLAHVRAREPFNKAVPAAVLGILAIIVVILNASALG